MRRNKQRQSMAASTGAQYQWRRVWPQRRGSVKTASINKRNGSTAWQQRRRHGVAKIVISMK